MMFPIERKTKSCWIYLAAISAIPLFFLIALVGGYVGILPLKVELHTVSIVAFIFVVFTLFARHNANYAVCKMRAEVSRMEDALHEALRANALTIMGKTKSTMGIETFFENYYKGLRNDNYAQVAPSVFPMLGILGTFVAIAISMPDFRISDTQTLDREISILLSGIGTAFYASIYGILLSLVWIYFEKRGLSKADAMMLDMQRLYDARIWKKSELIKHEHMRREKDEHEIVETLKELFSPQAIKDLNEHYLQAFTSAITETSKHFEILTKQMRNAATELRVTVEAIEGKSDRLQAAQSIESNLEAFRRSAERLEGLLSRFDREVEHTFEAIDVELAKAVEQLGRLGRVLAEQNQMIIERLSTKER